MIRISRFLLILVVFILSCLESYAKDVRVKGYYRKDGTYVAPHYRSAPDGDFGNNWSTQGNVNPYTGKVGAKTEPPRSGYGNHSSNPSLEGDVESSTTTQAIPLNAHLNTSGTSWECNRGYKRLGSGCSKVEVPANAQLNYSGDGWTCDRGYRRSYQSCVAVEVPANARLNYSGDDWTCDRGYRRSYQSCVAVEVPANARLNYSGDDWVCEGNYTKVGNTCVQEPSNALVDGPCAENGTCYGDVSEATGKPKTIHVQGYYRKDGTYVRGHYRSK